MLVYSREMLTFVPAILQRKYLLIHYTYDESVRGRFHYDSRFV